MIIIQIVILIIVILIIVIPIIVILIIVILIIVILIIVILIIVILIIVILILVILIIVIMIIVTLIIVLIIVILIIVIVIPLIIHKTQNVNGLDTDSSVITSRIYVIIKIHVHRCFNLLRLFIWLFTGIVEILEVDFTTGEVFSNGETTNRFLLVLLIFFVDMLLIMIYKVFIMYWILHSDCF